MRGNPLLEPSNLPYGAPAFDRILPGDFLPAQKELQRVVLAKLEAIKNNPAPPDFFNTVEALEHALDPLERAYYLLTVLKLTAAHPAYVQIEPEFFAHYIAFHNKLMSDPVLLTRVKKIFSGKDKDSLNGHQQRLLNVYYQILSNNLKLSSPLQKDKTKIDQKLKKLQDAFSKNVISNKKFENGGLIPQILYLRHKKALMGGYDNFEEQVVGSSMAGNVETLEKTLKTLEKGYQALAYNVGPDDAMTDCPPLNAPPKLIDQNIYFEAEDVERILQTAIKKYFSLTLEDVTANFPVYRKGMKVCRVADEGARAIGLIYIDPFAHPGKKGNAWAQPFRPNLSAVAKDGLPIEMLCFQFQQDKSGRPADLTLRELRTVFHEFGHALQNIMIGGRGLLSTGSSPVDAVEIFSLLMEKLLTRSALAGAARDVTGKRIEHTALVRMLAEDEINQAPYHLYSQQKARIDLAAHSLSGRPSRIFDVLLNQLARETGYSRRFIDFECSRSEWMFGLYANYAGRYYAYEWADMAAWTVINQFSTAHGRFNKKDGKVSLRDLFSNSLAGGNVADAYRKIVGCDPDPIAPFRRYPALAAALGNGTRSSIS